MMAGNPNWWSLMKNGMHPQISPSQFVYPSYNVSDNPSLPSNPSHHQDDHGSAVISLSHLLLQSRVSGGEEEEERFGGTLFQQQKKFENWEDQVLNLNTAPFLTDRDDMKQEIAQSTTTNYGDYELSIHANRDSNIWIVNNPSHHHLLPVCSPITTSCITTNLTCNEILNFTGGAKTVPEVAEGKRNREQLQDRSSECDSLGIGVVHSGPKKARVHHFSPQPVLKVRKEKLMDRITALHQLVSPYGKTDTASVLSEASGYIRFLHAKIEALSSPYMRSASGNHQQHSDSQDLGVVTKDLGSRGLCLVPISCTQHVGSGDAADYWASAALGGGF